MTLHPRLHRPVARAALVTVIAAAITTGLGGCSIDGGKMNHQRSTNLANQRKAAIEFIGSHPEVEAIAFTREGSVSGSGTWAANALVSVGQVQYQAILGIGIGSTSWEPWPTGVPAPTPMRVALTYSDGTSEIVK